jgi:hypothetical protein
MPSRRDFLLSSLVIPAFSKLNFAGQSRVASGSQAFTVRSQGVATINFDGMIALAMGNPNRVSAGILDAHHHTPKMVVTRVSGNSNGRETDSEVIATLDAKQLKGGLFIDLQAATRAAEKCQVSKYYSSAGVRGDKNDLRWRIDFNELYGGRELHIDESKLWGKIHVNCGQWYASKLSEFKWRMVSADPARPAAALNFDRQVGSINSQIEMDRGDVLVIRGDDVDLRLDGGNGYRYTIELTNLPPEDMSNIDHFLYYYEIIQEVLPRYVPITASKAVSGYPQLCKPVAFDDTVLSTP